MIEWGYGKTVDPTSPVAEALEHLSRIKMIGEPFVVGVLVAGLYGISMLRWGYHCAAIHSLRKWWPDLRKPHLIYFLVNTSGWGLWAALYGAGLFQTIKWWDKAGQPVFVPDDKNLTEPLFCCWFCLSWVVTYTSQHATALRESECYTVGVPS
jgi:hypothetical protein